MSEIENKCLKLKEQISIYTKESFVCFFTDFIRSHPIRSQEGFASKLKSKLKDSLYLIALRLSTSAEGTEELVLSDDSNRILERVADTLNEILSNYLEHNHKPEYLDGVEARKRLIVHEATFHHRFL